MKKIILNIEGMTCSACSNGLEKYLNKKEGVEASVNLVLQTASITYDDKLLTKSDLEKYIKEAGFKSLGEDHPKKSSKKELVLIIFFALLAIFLMYLSMGDMLNLKIPDILNKELNPTVYLTIMIVSSALALIWGLDILKNGLKNLYHKMPNMDSLIGIGISVNFGYSLFEALNHNFHNLYFESVVMIILFVKIGRFIDHKNKAEAVETIKNLVTITPKEATILKEGKETIVTINEIKKGDIVICKPGEKIAVDGEIVKGKTHTDESFITGESKPISKKVGDLCLAGSLNYDGYIEYVAQNIGKDSSISHVVDLVVSASNSKAPIARLADIISGYFVPIIFLIALLAFVLNLLLIHNFGTSILALVTVLVVACPCSLGLATPLAMVVSLGTASKKGFVIKNSATIEALNKIDTVVFDKTGTLTKGSLEIVDYKVIGNKSETLKILASLEAKSNHPLAKSICQTKTAVYTTSDFKELSGKGVQAQINNKMYYAGNNKFLATFNIPNPFINEEKEYTKKGESIIYLWTDEEVLAIYGLRDELKDNIKIALNNLTKLNKKIVMLSGDNETTAEIIAQELHIKEVYANASPENKVAIIKKLNTNQNVLMVGDGINDSPALKTAAIGLSVSNGTDISNDAADIIMLAKDMNKLTDLFTIGNKTIHIIKQNLFWALFYNVCMIPLATNLFAVKLNPMFASLAMVLSSLIVVLNSLRLKKDK